MNIHQIIPATPQEIIALKAQPVTDEVIAAAIIGVIKMARSLGQSLEDLQAEVLADDNLLDLAQRRRLRDIVTHAWETLDINI